MKVNQILKRTAAWSLSALMLSAVLMGTVACTRDESKNPGGTSTSETTSVKPAVTTPAQNGGNNGSGNGTTTDKPLNPDAGTVAPDGDAGNPPAGTENGTGSNHDSGNGTGTKNRPDSFRSRFMK